MNRIILYTFFFIFFSCFNNEKKDKMKSKNNTITITVNNIPKDFVYKLKNGSPVENQNFDIQYYNGEVIFNLLIGGKEKFNENNNTSENYIEIVHSLNALDENSILIRNGDSLNITYENKKPKFSISNRKTKKHDLDYGYLVRKYIYKTEFPLYLQSKNDLILLFCNQDTIFKNKISLIDFKKNMYTKVIKELKKEIVFLDSLYNKDELSKENYNYFVIKNKYNTYHVDFNSQSQRNEIDLIASDTLIKYKFYRDYVDEFFLKNFKIKQITVSDGSILDSKTAFDLVSQSKLFGQKTKKYLLDQYIEKICKEFKKNESSVYLEKYLKLTNDQKKYDNLKSNFFFTTNNSIDKLTIINSNKKTLNINEIIINKKLVYIDFWASWCAPCRASFPASRKLHEKFRNRDIEFVYISIDKNFEAWQKAHQKETLDSKYSFLATNYPEANFYKENQLKSIPRYMIFHNGKLVNNNAPSPDSPEIEKELEKYLSKN